MTHVATMNSGFAIEFKSNCADVDVSLSRSRQLLRQVTRGLKSSTKVRIASCLSTHLVSHSCLRRVFLLSGISSTTVDSRMVVRFAERLKKVAADEITPIALRTACSFEPFDIHRLSLYMIGTMHVCCLRMLCTYDSMGTIKCSTH